MGQRDQTLGEMEHTSDLAEQRDLSGIRWAGSTSLLGGSARPALSAREGEVLLAWLRADSKNDAARTLYISTGTMNTHISRIRAKYAAVGRPATTKAALFARALQDGLTRLTDW